jgi:hypothetical protein
MPWNGLGIAGAVVEVNNVKYLAAWMLGVPGILIVVWFLFSHMH